MKAVFLNTDSHEIRVVDIEDRLDVFYEMIGCSTIEIPRRFIGKKLYSIICDEEATFVKDPVPSMIDHKGNILILGSLIVCGKPDEEGNLTSLTDEDIERIRWNVAWGASEKHANIPLIVGSYFLNSEEVS